MLSTLFYFVEHFISYVDYDLFSRLSWDQPIYLDSFYLRIAQHSFKMSYDVDIKMAQSDEVYIAQSFGPE